MPRVAALWNLEARYQLLIEASEEWSYGEEKPESYQYSNKAIEAGRGHALQELRRDYLVGRFHITVTNAIS